MGDALSLRFYILDHHTPYQIFVRELIALDGVDSSEILLIDSLGCPTDPTIMGAISTVDQADGAQVLQAPFDAFKFPTSDVVQFKALVTPCLPKCEPVVCDVEDYYGMVRRVDSYGRRRRRREVAGAGAKDEDVLLVQSIRIADKFQFDADPRGGPAGSAAAAGHKHNLLRGDDPHPQVRPGAGGVHRACVTASSLLLSAAVFLGLQVLLAAGWVYLWRPRDGGHAGVGVGAALGAALGSAAPSPVGRRTSRASVASSRSSCRSVLAYHSHPPGQHWQRFYHAP